MCAHYILNSNCKCKSNPNPDDTSNRFSPLANASCKHMSALPLLEIETCVAGGCVGSDETPRCESRHSPPNQQTVARLLGSSFNTHSITPSSWLKRQQHHPTPTASTTTSILCISHIMLAGTACMCSLNLNSNCKCKSNPNPNPN